MNKQQSKVRYSIRKVSIGILSISMGYVFGFGYVEQSICR